MATRRIHRLFGQEVEPPKNDAESSIKLVFDKTKANTHQQLSVTNYQWVRENAKRLLQHYNEGKIYHGIPYQRAIERGALIEELFDGYLDMSDPGSILDCELICDLHAVERHGVDWLGDVADSRSPESLEKVYGEIIPAQHFYWMPYVISKIPDYEQAFMLLLQLITMVITIIDQIESLLEIGATFVTIDYFEWSAILKMTLRIIYVIILFVTLIKVTLDLINMIIQPVKYHACMKVIDLLRIIVEHFGYALHAESFENTRFANLFVMPEKYLNPRNKDDNSGTGFGGIELPGAGLFQYAKETFGFAAPNIEQKGYLRKTCGNILRDFMKSFKHKIVIDGDDLYFLPEWKQIGAPQYQLPDLYKTEYKTNAHELFSNYIVEFALDLNDKNTYHDYLGTVFQVITSEVNPPTDKALNMIKNAEVATIPFARASRKNELTLPEKLAKILLDVFSFAINGVILGLNGAILGLKLMLASIETPFLLLEFLGFDLPDFLTYQPPFIPFVDLSKNFIGDRIGMMLLENDFVNVQKMFLIESKGGGQPKQGLSNAKLNRLPTDNIGIVSARNFWGLWHGPAVSFLPSDKQLFPFPDRPNGNQFMIKTYEKIPFCIKQFEKVKVNNHILSASGTPALLNEGDWDDWNEQLDAEIYISELYAPNLIEKYIEPNGM